MRKAIYVVFTAFAVTLFLSNEDGALPQNTGAPGDLTCGRAPCHNIPSNVGDALLVLELNEDQTQYVPGEEISITFSLSNTDAEIFGFQLLALNENNQNAGTWILTEPNKMKIIDGIADPSRKYVTHTENGNQFQEWTLNWKAPDLEEGAISFYLSVLEGNNNGQNTGDQLYNTSGTLTPAGTTSIADRAASEGIKVYPNPVKSFLFIDRSDRQAAQGIIYDLSGNQLQQFNMGGGLNRVDLGGFSSGLYLLEVLEEDKPKVIPVIKQ